MSPVAPPPPGKINFPNMLGTKRRRMRSGGGVSTATNNTPKGSSVSPLDKVTNPSLEQTTQTSRCKGATTIPIFLKKTYKMIDTCDPKIASWTPDGEMFVVKQPDVFATTVIPQYFDHNKFSSFARQLNFYGFRKMQAKPIRNADFNVDTAKHVTFYNEKFKRGRCDLLKEIQRSTRGGNAGSSADQAKEIESLKQTVRTLEDQMTEMTQGMEDRMRRLELDMLGRMEQMMLAMQQQQQTQIQLQQQSVAVANGGVDLSRDLSLSSMSMQPPMQPWDPLPLDRTKTGTSFNSAAIAANIVSEDSLNSNGTSKMPAPTLPPHPKQKQLPTSGLPGSLNIPPSRLNSLRGLSRNLSRGVSGLSVDSTASAVLLRNSWEDKFFSMLMLDENGNQVPNPQAMAAAAAAGQQGPIPDAQQQQQKQASYQQQQQSSTTPIKQEDGFDPIGEISRENSEQSSVSSTQEQMSSVSSTQEQL